jgi:hypothetical protein
VEQIQFLLGYVSIQTTDSSVANSGFKMFNAKSVPHYQFQNVVDAQPYWVALSDFHGSQVFAFIVANSEIANVSNIAVLCENHVVPIGFTELNLVGKLCAQSIQSLWK